MLVYSLLNADRILRLWKTFLEKALLNAWLCSAILHRFCNPHTSPVIRRHLHARKGKVGDWVLIFYR